jgi:hypothetical protein
MSLRNLHYLRIKQDYLDFATHYLPDFSVVIMDGHELCITFNNTYLVMAFYTDKDVGDNRIRVKNKIYSKHGNDSPLVFGNLYDGYVQDNDIKKGIRTVIEMGKAFDIAYGYEKELIGR